MVFFTLITAFFRKSSWCITLYQKNKGNRKPLGNASLFPSNRRCTNQNIGNFLAATQRSTVVPHIPWHWSLGTGILVTWITSLFHFFDSSWEGFTSWIRWWWWSLGSKNGPDWWCQESNANEELLLLTQQPAPKERKRSRVLQTSTHAFIDPVSPYAKNRFNRGRDSLEGATIVIVLAAPPFEEYGKPTEYKITPTASVTKTVICQKILSR